MSIDLFQLLSVLREKKLLREIFSDPRIPPRLRRQIPRKEEVDADSDEHEVRAVDLESLSKKPKKNNRDNPNRISDNPNLLLHPDTLDWEVELAETDFEEVWYSNREFDPERDLQEGPGGEAFVDCFAWYCPFHYYTSEYGIYIKSDGLDKLAQTLALLVPAVNRKKIRDHWPVELLLRRAAFYYFFLHEMYHHKVESFATRLEIVTNSPVYVPYKASVYKPAQKPILTDDLLEEGLAVAEVFRRIYKDPPYSRGDFWGDLAPGIRVLDLVREYVRCEIVSRRLPEGYRTASRYLSPKDAIDVEEFYFGQRTLMSMIQEAIQKPLRDSSEWILSPDIFRSLFNKDHVVHEVLTGRGGRLPFHAAPAAQSSPRKVIRQARKWKIQPISRGGRTRGDHQWLENHRGTQDHIDTGGNDMSSNDWKALLGLVKDAWSVVLKDNQEGRGKFQRGPKPLGCQPIQ